ncbi:MAG: hypothetical protein AB8G17_11445 [Gammaproteobacteria bacterium]
MSRCTRFEDEGLLRIERGEALDSHFDECTDCRHAQQEYVRLKRAIGSLDEELEPSPEWQERVLDSVKLAGATRANTSRWWVGGVALAASAVVAAVLLNTNPGRAGSLSHELFSGQVAYRGAAAKPGDQLRLQSTARGSRYTQLRLYRDDQELIFSCNDGPPCEQESDRIFASVALTAFGRYQAVLLMSDSAIPPATGALDHDVLTAREAGSQVIVGESIDVR